MDYKTYKVKINIKELIENYDISMRELARKAAIDPSKLNKLANGQRESIYIEHIEKIANALDVDDISKIISLKEQNDSCETE